MALNKNEIINDLFIDHKKKCKYLGSCVGSHMSFKLESYNEPITKKQQMLIIDLTINYIEF